MSQLTEFYRNQGKDSEGRTLAEIWGYSDDDMEHVHDFIQWLFPLREASRFNRAAPLLTDADIAEFRADHELRENLLRSFVTYLRFLGIRYADGRIEKLPDFDRREVFQHPDHNWLRITRVLTSTRLLGLEAQSRAFFEFLKALRASGQTGITTDTFRYWENAALAGAR